MKQEAPGAITVSRRADAEHVRADLERTLLSNRWREGDKLPTERELCEYYGAARNTVRRALQTMEEAGLIVRHIGRGTFRTSQAPTQAISSPDVAGVGFSPANVVEARLVLEPAMAALAVARAIPADIVKIHEYLLTGDIAGDLPTFEHWDAEFHDAIAAATHNTAVIQMSRMLAQIRRDAEWGQLKAEGATPERMVILKQQHHSIFNAFAARDKSRASQEMYNHLRYIQSYMFGI